MFLIYENTSTSCGKAVETGSGSILLLVAVSSFKLLLTKRFLPLRAKLDFIDNYHELYIRSFRALVFLFVADLG